MAERRVSSRGSRPTKKFLDTQAIDDARRQHKAREAASNANRTPFQARGEQHASSLRDGKEPQEEESGDSSGEDEEEEVVVAQQQRQLQPGPSKAKKASTARKGKWTPVAKAMLASQGELLS